MSEEPPKPKAKRIAKPKRPAHLAHGRWLGDLGDLSPFENRLVAACARGEVCSPYNWDGKRPEADAATEANTIQAELIRFLALGGDSEHPVHENGVMLRGVWIKGELSLHQAKGVVRLDLRFCHFDSEPVFTAARLPELVLSGSKVPSLRADRMIVKGGVFLDDGIEASGEVRLLGAQIGGNLDCSNGKFSNPEGDALIADGLAVKGSVFLRNAKIEGAIDLTAARIATLVDHIACWQAGGHVLDGLHYDRIIGPTDANMRIDLLMKQAENELCEGFAPQPWEQLIKTLREMGHPYEAAQVAIAKQKQLRKAGKIEGPTRKALHWLYGFLAGYGYQPMKLVVAMIWLWLGCAFFFSVGGDYGYMGPSTPLLNNPELALSIDENCGHRREVGKQVWTKCANMPAEYTTFQPLLYSLDMILPLVDLQQESDWAPIVEEAPGVNMNYGVFLRWLMWFEILFGWMASLMLVAILGRLVDKD